MREFDYSKIKEEKYDQEILGYIKEIYKAVGKQELYVKNKPLELEKLVEIAKIQSTESSNAIEGIYTANSRIRMLMNEKTTPRNRDEKEIAGYRDALNLIHQNYDYINITPNYIMQLHQTMYNHIPNPMAGKIKNVQNYISMKYRNGKEEIIFTPLSPVETKIALTNICDEFNKVVSSYDVEPLILIPTFIHDFLCIHPFNDGNGRMSRLLTTLLLYRSNIYVGKYISLETKIALSKDLYYSSLRESQEGWHEGTEDKTPFIKYILSTILEACKDLDTRYDITTNCDTSIDNVRNAILSIVGKFTKQDIIDLCPYLGLSTIELSLRKLVLSNEIKKEGVGKNTFYYRTK